MLWATGPVPVLYCWQTCNLAKDLKSRKGTRIIFSTFCIAFVTSILQHENIANSRFTSLKIFGNVAQGRLANRKEYMRSKAIWRLKQAWWWEAESDGRGLWSEASDRWCTAEIDDGSLVCCIPQHSAISIGGMTVKFTGDMMIGSVAESEEESMSTISIRWPDGQKHWQIQCDLWKDIILWVRQSSMNGGILGKDSGTRGSLCACQKIHIDSSMGRSI